MTELPGNAGLGRDHHVFPDVDVVADVHQVVDFRAPADARDIQGAAVDRRVGADFDVVFNLEPANLREFFVASGLASGT